MAQDPPADDGLVPRPALSGRDGFPLRLLLVALFLLTATLGQVISHTATVLIVVPIALAAAPMVWPFAP